METREPKGLISALSYRDPKAAFRWLEDAFGFEPSFVLLDEDGNLGHAQMTYGQSTLMVGSEWDADHVSPASVGGRNTQTVHVKLDDGEDIDAHCARAREAGAWVIAAPETQFYGDRTYRACDPEGHIWTFAVTVEHTTPEQWRETAGFTVHERLE